MIQTHMKDKKIIPAVENPFHNSKVAKRVESALRFDGLNHVLGREEKKSRCALCGNTTEMHKV